MIPASYLFKTVLDDRWGNPASRFAAPEGGRLRLFVRRPAQPNGPAPSARRDG